MAEIGGILFIYTVLFFAPGYLLFLFGGWPCVAIFAGATVLRYIANRAMEWG